MWVMPWDFEGNVPLEYSGQDVINVNNRIYNCTRYTYSSLTGGNGTVWVDKYIPIPVKITETNGMINNKLELTEWG
jgi:hypothetical protein